MKKGKKKLVNKLREIRDILTDAAIKQLSKPYEIQQHANEIIDRGYADKRDSSYSKK
jgi:hypothetical protein